MLNLRPIVHAILEDYALPWHGTHGVGPWARVVENGLRLANATGAVIEVVQWFAVFHDSRRVNEVTDTGHGQRGADLATELRGQQFMTLALTASARSFACTAKLTRGALRFFLSTVMARAMSRGRDSFGKKQKNSPGRRAPASR